MRSKRPPKDPIDPKAQAIKLLARREHSARELTRKLKARGVGNDEAAAAVGEVASEGWQDDTRYAAMLVRSRVAQGYGPQRIEAELRVAGLPADKIRAALDDSGVDWREQARAAHEKKFGALPKTSAERAKHYRFLQGRGYDGSQIGAVLKGEVDD
jgi:regulatory protein